ncbi:MAG: EAL domain-containing protein [Sulfurimonas sp.]|nr:EAL domain-containing protein [Sulfurimonas sp.]
MAVESCTTLDDTNVNEVPITNKEYQTILDIQQEVLMLTAQEAKAQAILDRICEILELLLPNAVASLMLKKDDDDKIYVRAAPSIPDAGWNALNQIVPGPKSGSCGNAIFHGEAQFITDVLTDERGTKFLQTAKAFNLCSCWSMPIKDEDKNTIGSIALSSFEHRSPALFHKKLLETASSLVTIVLKNEQNKSNLQDMIYRDRLTGLENKTSLQEMFKDSSYQTLIFLDINNFAYVNTAYGFVIGDKILIRVARMLQKIYSENIYRINADQFAIRFEEKMDILAVVHRIKEYFAKNIIKVENVKLKITFTYGAIYSNKDLLKHAALAIKKAKESGKNRLHIFNEDFDSSKKRESFISINTLLYTAFDEDMIVPFYQGIYNNTKEKITKYEALVRIVTKDGEIITPYKFLDVAKLSGLLPTLTKIMIEKTFKFMSQNSYDFSINITEDDLTSYYLVNYLLNKAKEHSIKPSRLTLEILEGISSSGQKNNIRQLKKLKKHGFKLAIDDFGAEYSNFERVLDLEVDFLKIDARYIKNINTDKKSYEIVKAIVNFASNMNIAIVAEFVHSKAVQKVVQDLGISYSQGYYFSEPSKKLLK